MPWGDPTILNRIRRESLLLPAGHMRESFLRAAVQTGLVESGGRNLPGGDADSQGWRQERASLYRDPRNVGASVRRFRQEFQQFYKPGLRSYEIAARVQRPAAQFRGRYRDVAGEAARILRGAGVSGGNGAPGAQGVAGTVSAGPVAGSSVPEGSQGLVALLQALNPGKRAPSSGGLPAPAFSAQAALPAGYQALSSGGGPAPKPDVGALMDAIRTAGGSVGHSGVGGAQASFGMPGAGGAVRPASGVRMGKVVIPPSADRPGVRTRPEVVNFLRQVAGIYGRPLTVGTGTNHSRMTVNGNVSDHWDGHGADVPLKGQALVLAGQAALIAAGMSPAQARRQRGGLYNVPLKDGGRVQVIFATSEGGDHTTHLHVGYRPGRR